MVRGGADLIIGPRLARTRWRLLTMRGQTAIAAPPSKMIREEQSQRPREDIVGLLVMIVGLILFLGVHTLTTQRGLRAQCIAAMGEGGYKIGYAVASFV